MSWIKTTLSFINARRHPDEVTREVETELRFHIAMRTRANIERGMKPHDAQSAAAQSFGDFQRVKNSCCEIRRSLPFDSTPFKMGLHISLAVLSGLAALWAVNAPHHNFTGVMRQLIPIAVLAYLFIFVRRARSQRLSDKSFISDVSDTSPGKITAYDEQGLTPVERLFKS